MTEFNHKILADLVIQGYKYMVYEGKGDHALLYPLKEALSDDYLASKNAWQLEITEREFQDMATGEDGIDFKFYVSENSFAVS